MNNNYPSTNSKPRNFGGVTDISKEINAFFGDTTGRSISMRTAHGFKRALKRKDMDDNTAEDIVHATMTLAPILLKQKNDAANGVGTLLIIALLGCYWNGK